MFFDTDAMINAIQTRYALKCTEKIGKMDKEVIGPIIEKEFAVCVTSHQMKGLTRKRSWPEKGTLFEDALKKFMGIEEFEEIHVDYGTVHVRAWMPQDYVLGILEKEFTGDYIPVPRYLVRDGWYNNIKAERWHKSIVQMGAQQVFDSIKKRHSGPLLRWEMRGLNVILRQVANYLRAFLLKERDENPNFMNYKKYGAGIYLNSFDLEHALRKDLETPYVESVPEPN